MNTAHLLGTLATLAALVLLQTWKRATFAQQPYDLIQGSGFRPRVCELPSRHCPTCGLLTLFHM